MSDKKRKRQKNGEKNKKKRNKNDFFMKNVKKL